MNVRAKSPAFVLAVGGFIGAIASVLIVVLLALTVLRNADQEEAILTGLLVGSVCGPVGMLIAIARWG